MNYIDDGTPSSYGVRWPAMAKPYAVPGRRYQLIANTRRLFWCAPVPFGLGTIKYRKRDNCAIGMALGNSGVKVSMRSRRESLGRNHYLIGKISFKRMSHNHCRVWR